MKTRLVVLLLLLALSMLFSSCAESLVTEEPSSYTLPAIDPSSAMQTDEQASLYFRLRSEDLLVSIPTTFHVSPQENFPELVIKNLLKGPDKSDTTVASIIPPGTALVSVTREKDILRVVLSKQFLNSSHISGSPEAIKATQRLSVYSIVNTLCAIQSQNIKNVEILVDMQGDGIGVRVAPEALGFSDTQKEWLMPLTADDTLNATQQNITALALSHLAQGNYERAYALFATENVQNAPTQVEFTEQFRYRTRIMSFAIKGLHLGEATPGVYIILDIDAMTEDGVQFSLQNAAILMQRERYIYRLDYHSLTQALVSQQ